VRFKGGVEGVVKRMSIKSGDIISIDAAIKQTFREDEERLPEKREKLADMERALGTMDGCTDRLVSSVEATRDKLREHIADLEESRSLSFYIQETVELVNEYRKLLEGPIRQSFMGKKGGGNGRKRRVAAEYLKVARQYVDIAPIEEFDEGRVRSTGHGVVCPNPECGNKRNFDVENGNTYICQECFSEQISMGRHTPSPNDIERVNVSAKYMYDRKVHFRDCINQYQGLSPSRTLYYQLFIPLTTA